MSDPRLEPLDPDQRRAVEALRALPSHAADPAFRARLERAFAEGLLAPQREARSSRRWFETLAPAAWLRWAAVPLAVSAALIGVAILDQPSPWRIARIAGSGIAVVDGRPIALDHRDDLARAIRPGVRLRMPPGSELEIMSGGRIAMHVLPATDLTVPGLPGRWFARRVTGEVARGEVRITTGAAFHGARLAIDTPAARIEVTGTTLAVICEPEGTCVCVLEGRVRVGPRIGPMAVIEQGSLRYTFIDGRDPVVADIRPVEALGLARMRDEKRASLGMPRP